LKLDLVHVISGEGLIRSAIEGAVGGSPQPIRTRVERASEIPGSMSE
jgi:hypothetical protein